jgi:hypothetical protein
MFRSKKAQWIVFSILVVTLGAISYAKLVPANSPNQAAPQSTSAQRNGRLLPLIDEDPASARQPLSAVLGHLDLLDDPESMDTFNNTIRSRVRHRQFQDLDVFTAELRKSRATLPGGEWQLYRVYGLMAEPSAGWYAPDADWQAELYILEEWTRTFPESITARVAYANTYINWGWSARGSGWSHDVKNEEWDRFLDRARKGERALMDAKLLSARCPHWYYLMQRVALTFSWDREEYDRLFDEAVAFEPLYNSFYSAKANYLLPRWYGRQGELEDFLTETPKGIGGREATAIFYHAFTAVEPYLDQPETTVRRFWPRIKQGYQSVEAVYHVTPEITNAQAKMAYAAGDREEAIAAFERIGEGWRKDVWKNYENFERARNWALGPDPAGTGKQVPEKG